MLWVIGIIGIAFGAAVAAVSERFPAYAEALETGAGVLLIGGLALTGYALPVIL